MTINAVNASTSASAFSENMEVGNDQAAAMSTSEIWPEFNEGPWANLSDEEKLQVQGFIEQGMFSALMSFAQSNSSIEGNIRSEWNEIING